MRAAIALMVGVAFSAATGVPVFGQRVEEQTGVGDYTDRPIQLYPGDRATLFKTKVSTFESSLVDQPFTGIVVRFVSHEPAPVAWVRFTDDETTSDWRPAVITPGAPGAAQLLGYHSDVVISKGRVEVALGAEGVRILDAGVFDNRVDDDRQIVEWDQGQTFKGFTTGKIIPPKMIGRSEWGASPFRGDPIPLARPTYDRITFHHAACCGAYDKEEGIRQVKGIQTFHQDGRGWSDIGYHFLLDQSGRLYQGRPFMNPDAELADTPVLAQGAHVGGYNTGNIGVSVLGCYHPPEGSNCVDVLSPAAYDSLVTVIAFLSERYDVPPARIAGHRDFSSTACPGDNNYRLLPEIRQRVARLLVTGNRPVGTATISAAVTEDGVVTLGWTFTRDDGIVRYVLERTTSQGTNAVYTSRTVEDLSFVDRNVRVGGLITYSLVAWNADGRPATLASADVEVVNPITYQLSGSFPNPTQSTTTIRYFVAQDGLVRIELFDSAGRLVNTLGEGFRQGNRWYTISLPVDNLTSGQYYYRMQVEGFSGVVFDETRGLSVNR